MAVDAKVHPPAVVVVAGGKGERDAGVRDLCLAVEQACLHGIKTQASLARSVSICTHMMPLPPRLT